MRQLSNSELSDVSGGDCIQWTVTQGNQVLASWITCSSGPGGLPPSPDVYLGGLNAALSANFGLDGSYVGSDPDIQEALDGDPTDGQDMVAEGLNDPAAIENVRDEFQDLSQEEKDAIEFVLDALQVQLDKLGVVAQAMGLSDTAAAMHNAATQVNIVSFLLGAPGEIGPWLQDPGNTEAAADALAFVAAFGVGLGATALLGSGPVGLAVGAIGSLVVGEYGDDAFILLSQTSGVVSDFVEIYSTLSPADLDPAFDQTIVNPDGTTNLGYFEGLFGIPQDPGSGNDSPF